MNKEESFTIHSCGNAIKDHISKIDGTFYKTYINDVPATLNRIAEQYQQNEKALEVAGATLRDFHAQAYKDKELVKMRNTYDRMRKDYYRGFPISKEENERIRDWKDKHERQFHNGKGFRGGAIGGSYAYQFIKTTIGTSGTVYCNSCRSKAIRESNGNVEKYEKILNKYNAEFVFKELD